MSLNVASATLIWKATKKMQAGKLDVTVHKIILAKYKQRVYNTSKRGFK